MFTGLVKEKASVVERAADSQGGFALIIEKPSSWNDLLLGESIATNGVCLTLTAISPTEIKFFVGRETLDKSNFDNVKAGDTVNLERSLTLGDRIGGHLVSGHIDGTALVTSVEVEGECLRFQIIIPKKLAEWVVIKGSLAINGVSLTVNSFDFRTGQAEFYLIPETLARTNLSQIKVGALVNIECDQVVKILVEHKSRFENKGATL